MKYYAFFSCPFVLNFYALRTLGATAAQFYRKTLLRPKSFELSRKSGYMQSSQFSLGVRVQP